MIKLTKEQKKLLNSSKEQEPIVEQRSEEWFELRRGKITSSEIHKIIGKDDTLSETAKTYLLERVSEQLGGVSEPIDNMATKWGKETELPAIAFFEKQYSFVVNEASFIPYNDFMGGSPDGIIDADSIIEVKCPFVSKNHFKHGLIDTPEEFKKIANNYYWQCMANMLVTGASNCYFISFDPRVQPEYIMFVYKLQRDEKEIELLKKRIDISVAYMEGLKKRLSR